MGGKSPISPHLPCPGLLFFFCSQKAPLFSPCLHYINPQLQPSHPLIWMHCQKFCPLSPQVSPEGLRFKPVHAHTLLGLKQTGINANCSKIHKITLGLVSTDLIYNCTLFKLLYKSCIYSFKSCHTRHEKLMRKCTRFTCVLIGKFSQIGGWINFGQSHLVWH